MLEKATLSGGKYVTGGATFAIAAAHEPVRAEGGDYERKLRSISGKFVVFWDEMDKRGWLVNGTSALLHLARSYLLHEPTKDSRDPLVLEEPSEDRLYKSDTAFQILTNESNREMEIHMNEVRKERKVTRKKGQPDEVVDERTYTFYLFQDLVWDLHNLLEKMMDYQRGRDVQNGLRLKCSIRQHIDGWHFNDVVNASGDIFPRVTTLDAMGDGWLDLMSKVGAVTLFGEGFGEIIKPVDAGTYCTVWAEMPKDRYYLGACGSDLVTMANHSNANKDDLINLTSTVDFSEACSCSRATTQAHTDQRSKRCHRLPVGKQACLNPEGAAIFDYRTAGRRLYDFGNRIRERAARRSDPLCPPTTDIRDDRDSALGSSLVQPSDAGNSNELGSTTGADSTASQGGVSAGESSQHLPEAGQSGSTSLSNAHEPSRPVSSESPRNDLGRHSPSTSDTRTSQGQDFSDQPLRRQGRFRRKIPSLLKRIFKK